MNTDYFSAAQQFVLRQGGSGVILCGHSLGGAVAQIIGNRQRLPFATFNAPGVAVLASRNILSTTKRALQLRLAGMLVSAAMKPAQAWADIKSAFYVVEGINVCLKADPISRYGVHYGRMLRIAGTVDLRAGAAAAWDSFKVQHGIETVSKALLASPFANKTIAELQLSGHYAAGMLSAFDIDQAF